VACFVRVERHVSTTNPRAAIRAGERSIRHGRSLPIVNARVECDGAPPLAGYRFREAGDHSALRRRVNGLRH
jgi:hypothetical protein